MENVPMSPHTITPFANESEALGIDELNIENREDRVSIYGSLDVTRDQEGLKKALILKEVLDKIVDALKREKLPDKLPAPRPAAQVKNPFAEGE
jgi:hypothetical protein